jgi:hypothetical protein
MKKLLLTTLLLCGMVSALAQDVEKSNLNHRLGLSAGATTGLGFSYRYMNDKIGFQVTGIPVIRGEDNYRFFSTGGSLLYPFRFHETTTLFAYAGVHNIYEEREWPNFMGGVSSYKRNWLSVGLGVGANFEVWDVMEISFQFGYAGYDLAATYANGRSFMLTGEFGVYYKF